MNEEKIVKWFYDHEELLLEIMDKKPYQSDGWDYEIEIVKAFLAQQSNEQVEQRLELIGHADLAINNIYIFSGYGEEVPEGRTPIYAGYKNTHPPVPTAQPEPKYTTTRNAWTGTATHKCNQCGREDFRSEHAAKFHKCEAVEEPEPHSQDRWLDIQLPDTTPPQRTWVSLTDDELELLNSCGDTDSYKFAKSIEAKLKGKNT